MRISRKIFDSILTFKLLGSAYTWVMPYCQTESAFSITAKSQ